MAMQSSKRGGGVATFLVLFTLPWCSVSFGFFYVACREANGAMVLGSLVFVVIGLGLLALTIRQVLNLFNPTVQLSFTPDQPSPDSELTISWRLSGGARKIRLLQIAFEGYEWVKYSRGTDTTEEEHVFASHPVHLGVEQAEMQSGVVRFMLPHRTIPSFAASQNAIRWRVHFLGEIPRWPDLDAKFDVTVVSAKPSLASCSDSVGRG